MPRNNRKRTSKAAEQSRVEQEQNAGAKRQSTAKKAAETKPAKAQKMAKEQGRKQTGRAGKRTSGSQETAKEKKCEEVAAGQETGGAAGGEPLFKSTVTWTVQTDFDATPNVVLSVGQFITVGGYCKKQKQQEKSCRLQQYDFQGNELRSASLRDDYVWSMREISLGRKDYLAVAYRSGTQQLEFRDLTNPEETLLKYDVKPHSLGLVCKESPTTLLYENYSSSPPDIQRLDCSGSTPQPEGAGVGVTHTKVGTLTEMLHTQHEDNGLLITTSWGSLCAYNMVSDKLLWKFTGEVPGFGKEMNALAVAVDGRGRIFVHDRYNACVHAFSLTGEYMGVVFKEGEHGIGGPMLLSWCDEISSLIIVHIKGKSVKMSALKLEGI